MSDVKAIMAACNGDTKNNSCITSGRLLYESLIPISILTVITLRGHFCHLFKGLRLFVVSNCSCACIFLPWMLQYITYLWWYVHQIQYTVRELTLVATAKMATPWRIGCHAPISWAFSGTIRRNCVVIFHASTRISNRLFTRARRGASGKEATKSVTKPNWITVRKQQGHSIQIYISSMLFAIWNFWNQIHYSWWISCRHC